MEKLKIGITIGLKSNTESIWTNGIKLNILILLKLLKKSQKNYDVCLLNTLKVDFTDKPDYLKNIDIHYIEDKYKEIDLMIVMGSQVNGKILQDFKNMKNKKIVSYKCGNNYILAMEDILFKENPPGFSQYETEFDEVWYIPQQHETNQGYYHTLYRANSLIVPFLWHQEHLLSALVDVEKGYQSGKFAKGYAYNPNKEKKMLGVMEPNLNVVKFCLLPVMIAEESYRTDIGKEKIYKMMISNSENLVKHNGFMSLIKSFDMYKDNKLTSEKRYQTAYVVSQYMDVVICHQLLNPLNYIYLDVAYMGYPVLHNAPMCKDLGYYYEGSDTIDGAKQLNWILENHDNNMVEYNERNDKVLWRYSADNPKLIETYDMLIHNLFNGGNYGLEYDETTNLYK